MKDEKSKKERSNSGLILFSGLRRGGAPSSQSQCASLTRGQSCDRYDDDDDVDDDDNDPDT